MALYGKYVSYMKALLNLTLDRQKKQNRTIRFQEMIF